MGHNARKLTQVNKPHKDSTKPKGLIKKVQLASLSKKKKADISKDLRVLKAQQRRNQSIKLNTESDYSKRGTNDSAPLLCGIFPLFEFKDIDVVFSLLKSTDQDAVIKKVENVESYTKSNCEHFIMQSRKFKKNFAFASCKNFRDRFGFLDLAKVVDWCLFILPNDLDELIGDYTEDLISGLIAQGLPSSCFITLSNAKDFKIKDESKYLESIIKISLGEERIQCLNNLNDANKLMRHLAQNCKPSYISSKKSSITSKSIHKKRGYFLIQNMIYTDSTNELRLTGCMRGFGVNLNSSKYLHITEIGDFPIKEAQWISPEESNRFTKGKSVENVKKFKVDHAIKTAEDDCVEDNDVKELSDEDMDDIGDSEDSEDMDSEEELPESEEEHVSDIGSDNSDNEHTNDQMSFATTAHSGFSMAQIAKFKDSRENAKFPDEVDLPFNEKAREKFSKYRGFGSFKQVQWPLDENLPECYRHLHEFKKYTHDRNRLCKQIKMLNRHETSGFVHAGSKVEIILGDVSNEKWAQLGRIRTVHPDRHFIASSLFKDEHRISVLHLNERRLVVANNGEAVLEELAKLAPGEDLELGVDATSHLENIDNTKLRPVAEPIASKESMLFQVGFRRFSSTPIYSEFTAESDRPGNAGKGKYCHFMEPKCDVVATLYGPVAYGPVSVLQFRLRQTELGMGELGDPYVAELVATGSLLSVDTSRPIVKRVLLAGDIYKVHKRSVIARYMFFDTDDIEFYKYVPIFTRGRRAKSKTGRIVGPHGTHGYMRCYFNEQVFQDEVPLMALYKRVFPKYTVENMYQFLPTAEQIQNEKKAVFEAMDTLF